MSARAALALLLVAAAAAADDERHSQMAPAPFVLGSRFGRSPPRMLAPRNDKFFVGSRYGKRSEWEPPLPPLPPVPPAPPALECEYTGARALYRCRPRPAIFAHARSRSSEEASGGEE